MFTMSLSFALGFVRVLDIDLARAYRICVNAFFFKCNHNCSIEFLSILFLFDLPEPSTFRFKDTVYGNDNVKRQPHHSFSCSHCLEWKSMIRCAHRSIRTFARYLIAFIVIVTVMVVSWINDWIYLFQLSFCFEFHSCAWNCNELSKTNLSRNEHNFTRRPPPHFQTRCNQLHTFRET